MNPLGKHHNSALTGLAGAALLTIAVVAGAAAQDFGPTLTKPAGAQKTVATDGFIPRWLLLEPIPSAGLTEAVVRAEAKKDYFPNQFTVIPKDGDKVTVNDKELTWHAVETSLYNVNLPRLRHSTAATAHRYRRWDPRARQRAPCPGPAAGVAGRV